MSISSKIKKIRELRGFSQEYMALQLNISQSAYSKIEKSDKSLNVERLQSIATIFEIDAIDLMSDNNDVIFNNCQQSGLYNTYNLHDKFIVTLESQIREQQNEILYLRKLLENELLSK